MLLKLVCVGKLSSGNNFKIICTDYQKRIKDKLEIIEIKSTILKKSERIKYEEKKILECLNKDEDIFLLDNYGKQYSSRTFSKILSDRKNIGKKKVTFVIGGAYGLHKNLTSRFSAISFGEMTWPHGLMRVLLLEQIYRAQTIINGHPYDK